MQTPTTRRIPLALALIAGCLPGPTQGSATTGTTTMDGTDSAGTTSAGATDPTTTSPTSSTGSTSSTGTSGSTTLCSFLDCAPDPLGGPSAECDMWTQDCPDGQKCMPWANGGPVWNATKCTDVMPNAGKPGDPCTVEGSDISGVDTCEKASMCWNVSQDTGEGTCVGFCMGSPVDPICPLGTKCVIAADYVLILCLPRCNPLLQDCPSMESCIPQPMGWEFECVPDVSGDMGQQNDPCTPGEACDPGLVCLLPTLASECDAMAPGCCLPFCDLSMPACTNMGATCLAWYEQGMEPPGLENVGVCGIPP